MRDVLEIFVDGACSGNPGPAAIGVVLRQDGKTVKEVSQAIGDATNNIAEYSALVYALQEALVLKADRVKVFTDSELVFSQVNGSYKVKSEHLKFLFDQVQHLKRGFQHVTITHIPREQNKEADKLATTALKKQAKTVAPLFDNGGEESPSSEG